MMFASLGLKYSEYGADAAIQKYLSIKMYSWISEKRGTAADVCCPFESI